MIVELRLLCGMTPWSDAHKLKMLGKTVNIMSRGSFHKAILATIDLSYLWLILWLPALIFTSFPRNNFKTIVNPLTCKLKMLGKTVNVMFQPVLHNWYSKYCDMYYLVSEMMHIILIVKKKKI